MTSNILDNLIILFTTIIIVTLYWFYLSPQIVDKIIARLEQTGWFLIFKIPEKPRHKYIVIISEFIFLLIMLLIVLAILFGENVYLFFYQCILYFFATVARLLRKEFPHFPSIGRKLEKIKVSPFGCSVVNEFIGMIFWVIPVAIIILIYFHLEWPNYILFMGFLIFPILLNLWIYFPSKGIKKGNIEARKFVTYCMLCLSVIIDAYFKFEGIIDVKLAGNEIPQFYFIQVSVLFIAIERIVKSVNDYKKILLSKD